jgi:3-mercaptopyruvate sulfurtransferase SseA
VLDGGLKKWLDDGFEVSEEEPEYEVFMSFLS